MAAKTEKKDTTVIESDVVTAMAAQIEELEQEVSGKWLSSTDVVDANDDTLFFANELLLDADIVGSVDGFGGSFNTDNWPGYSNDVVACVNVGGALGDSAWMEVGEPPLISFHCPDDGFAPFTQGIVIVPTTQEVVVDVVGSRWAIEKANELGNNDVLYGSMCVYRVRAGVRALLRMYACERRRSEGAIFNHVEGDEPSTVPKRTRPGSSPLGLPATNLQRSSLSLRN